MALRRFYVEPGSASGSFVQIRGDLFHHIREVCRFGVGARFEVLPGDGRALLVEIANISGRDIEARKISERLLPTPPKPRLTLALSIPKLPKVDWIVEKCVELGVHDIRPFVSEYSFLRKDTEISPARIARWQKLIQSATQQTGRGDLMKIHPATTLEKLLPEFNRLSAAGGLFPYEGESQLELKPALTALHARNLDQLWVFVGSEGGFSLNEVQAFADVGLSPVTLGEQILRVETACLALVSVIKYELGAPKDGSI